MFFQAARRNILHLHISPDVSPIILDVPDHSRASHLKGQSHALPREAVIQVLKYVSTFDRPAMRGQFGALLHIDYFSPEELLPQIKEILRTEGLPVAQSQQEGGIQLIALDRWGQVLVFAAEKNWLERVKYWVDLLDVPEKADDRRYFIYFPENSKARDLMNTLKSIAGLPNENLQKAGKDGAENKGEGITSPFFQPAAQKESTGESEQSAGKDGGEPSKAGGLAGTGIPGLAVDEARNALIIYTDAGQYQQIERLLKQLDIMPPQVLIEATVAEVTLTDNLQYGIEWFLKNTDGSQTSVLSTQGGLGLESAGLNFSMVTDSEKFRLLINALAEEELLQVLSSPHVTVRDGKTASINVGTQVPVVVSEVASAQGTTEESTGVVRAFQYRDTGVSLSVTPIVHARDVITLKISQDVSETSASGGENPLILNRTVSTDVVANSGQTLVIAGLIKENTSNRNSKVPFFGDLPLLGRLFQATNQGMDRSELVVMITPHIIRSNLKLDDIHQEIMKNFNHLKIDGTAR